MKNKTVQGSEIDLLVNYPKSKRNVEDRGQSKTEADRAIARKFGKEFFDGDRSQGYGGFNYLPRFWQPVVPTLQRHFGLDSTSSLLDVGCSAGSFLAAANSAGFSAQGVELNPDTADLARARGLNVTTGTLSDVHEAAHSFDAITMWDIVEHVPDPIALLSQARELLSESGWLWLTTPNIDGLFPQASLRVASSVGKWPHPEPPYHLMQFSEQTITDALHRAGFEQVVVKQQSIPLSYSFGSLQKMLTDPRRLVYAAAFAPLAFLGPLVGRGDTMLVAAKPSPSQAPIDLRQEESFTDLTEPAATPLLETPGTPGRSPQL